MSIPQILPLTASLALLLVLPASGQDFNVGGATFARDGRAATAGPLAPSLVWSNNLAMFGTSQPVIHGDTLFVQSKLVPQQGVDLIGLDLSTGSFRWSGLAQFPQAAQFLGIIGASHGRVFAWARLAGGNTRALVAFGAADGALLWSRSDLDFGFLSSGAAIEEGGDVFLTARLNLVRFDGRTGATEWTSYTGAYINHSCYSQGRLFAKGFGGAGEALLEFDPVSGAVIGGSGDIGFDDLSPPYVSPTERVFISRGFRSYGLDLQSPAIPTLWQDSSTTHELESQPAFADDGSLYMFKGPGFRLRRRSMDTGATLEFGPPSSVPLSGTYAITVDTAGTVYVSYGEPSLPGDTQLLALSADLQQTYFSLVLDGRDLRSPVVGGEGLLIVQDRTQLRAFRDAPIGATYCGPAIANASGESAKIDARGSLDLALQRVVVRAIDLPMDANGYFLASLDADFVPAAGGSVGNLCLGGSVGRFDQQVLSSGDSGRVELAIDTEAIPQPSGTVMALSGQSWCFQCWFRDSLPGGGGTSNFTDGVVLTFL